MDMEGGHGPATVSTQDVLEGLNDLLELDHDAIGAYQVAIEKLEDRDHAEQIAGFMRDHERHVRDLNALILEMGGEPKNKEHVTGPFKEALQGLGAVGGDKGLLMAFRTNEMQVRMKYDSYASKANEWPERVKAVIDRNALDEERHYRWVSDLLQRLGLGMSESAEIHEPARLREKMRKVGEMKDELTERASEGMDSVRDRAGELLEKSGVTNLRSDLETRTRENPMRAVLATFAVGFIIGRILR